MRTPPLLADFSHARVCKPFCENFLTLPDGTPFMKCCNRFIGIMGAVFTCLGLKSKRAKPSSAWLSYELLFHQIDFLDFFSKATPINRPIAEETRPVRKSKNSGIDITLARRYWLSERVSNP